jgi:hypothetical protein
MIKVNQPAKAKFRVGARVSYDYEAGTFKVVKKEIAVYGQIIYDIESADKVMLHRGVREKDLNPA